MHNLVKFGIKTIATELDSLLSLKQKLSTSNSDNFIASCNLIKNCKGKVIIMGMGKSGHISNKIAATFASTGTPSFFIHPAEAGHGDLGMIEKNDVVIYISYSGTAREIIDLMPFIKRVGAKSIAITGNKNAEISIESNIWLDGSIENEACPHNLAPTSSTTVALVIGDALAMAVLQDKGFSADDFARSHPAGALGKKLLTNVADIMQSGENLPTISQNIPLIDGLLIMSEKKLGMLIITDANFELKGIFTDGDLRRVIAAGDINTDIFAIMTKNPKFIEQNKPAISALSIMEEFNLNCLPVIQNKKVVGAINMQTLIQAKIV